MTPRKCLVVARKCLEGDAGGGEVFDAVDARGEEETARHVDEEGEADGGVGEPLPVGAQDGAHPDEEIDLFTGSS